MEHVFVAICHEIGTDNDETWMVVGATEEAAEAQLLTELNDILKENESDPYASLEAVYEDGYFYIRIDKLPICK